MNSHIEGDDNTNIRTKAITAAAIPMAGIIVAAALMSGLALFSTYTQPALAQQNMTATNATSTTPGGAVGTQSACTPTQTGVGGGGQNSTTNATTTGSSGVATNATSTTEEEGTQSTSEVREYIEAACTAAQNGDMQGVMMQLNLALNALGSNMTTTTGGGGAANATSTLAEVLTEGGNTTGSSDGEGE